MSLNLDRLTAPLVLATTLGRTFIQTGLFIVAHDAMHGTVLPAGAASVIKNRYWNDAIGRLAMTLYALLPYQKLATNHQRHHLHPGQASDPDFHDGVHHDVLAWYITFMGRYLDRRQQIVELFGIGAIFSILHWGFHAALPNLFLFWILPIVPLLTDCFIPNLLLLWLSLGTPRISFSPLVQIAVCLSAQT
jgi:beta-carotene/zeaxanthin 4-ketolase